METLLQRARNLAAILKLQERLAAAIPGQVPEIPAAVSVSEPLGYHNLVIVHLDVTVDCDAQAEKSCLWPGTTDRYCQHQTGNFHVTRQEAVRLSLAELRDLIDQRFKKTLKSPRPVSLYEQDQINIVDD